MWDTLAAKARRSGSAGKERAERSEVVVKEAEDAGEEVLAVGVAGDAVLLAGIYLHIKIHSCVYQSLDV